MARVYIEEIKLSQIESDRIINRSTFSVVNVCSKYPQCVKDLADKSTCCPLYNFSVGCLWNRLADALENINEETGDDTEVTTDEER